MSGVTSVVPELMWWLLLFGMVIALIRRPGWFTAYAATVILVAPFSSVLTDMVLRRSLIILPFGCILAGIGLSEVLHAAWKRSMLMGSVAVLASVILVGRISWTNIDDFFNATAQSQSVTHTFAVEFSLTMKWVRTLGEGNRLIFFSERWVAENEVGELLVPDIRLIAENRLEKWAGTETYEVDWSKGRPIFVLIGADQIGRLAAIEQTYPNGEVITGPTVDNVEGPVFVAYILPEDS